MHSGRLECVTVLAVFGLILGAFCICLWNSDHWPKTDLPELVFRFSPDVVRYEVRFPDFGTNPISVLDISVGKQPQRTLFELMKLGVAERVKNSQRIHAILEKCGVVHRLLRYEDSPLKKNRSWIVWRVGKSEEERCFNQFVSALRFEDLCGSRSVVLNDPPETGMLLLGGRVAFFHARAYDHPSPLTGSLNLNFLKGSFCRLTCLIRLPANYDQSEDDCPGGDSLGPCYEYVPPSEVIARAIAFVFAGFLLFGIERETAGTMYLAFSLIFLGSCMLLVGHQYYCPCE